MRSVENRLTIIATWPSCNIEKRGNHFANRGIVNCSLGFHISPRKYYPPRGTAPRDLCFGGTSQVKRKSTHGRASEVAKLAFIDGAAFQCHADGGDAARPLSISIALVYQLYVLPVAHTVLWQVTPACFVQEAWAAVPANRGIQDSQPHHGGF